MSNVDDSEFQTAVIIFAYYLAKKLDLTLEPESDLESQVCYIADKALRKLPENWELGIGDDKDNAGIPYFFNTATGESRWEHPNEESIVTKLERRLNKEQRKSQIKQQENTTVEDTPPPTTKEEKRVKEDKQPVLNSKEWVQGGGNNKEKEKKQSVDSGNNRNSTNSKSNQQQEQQPTTIESSNDEYIKNSSSNGSKGDKKKSEDTNNRSYSPLTNTTSTTATSLNNKVTKDRYNDDNNYQNDDTRSNTTTKNNTTMNDMKNANTSRSSTSSVGEYIKSWGSSESKNTTTNKNTMRDDDDDDFIGNRKVHTPRNRNTGNTDNTSTNETQAKGDKIDDTTADTHTKSNTTTTSKNKVVEVLEDLVEDDIDVIDTNTTSGNTRVLNMNKRRQSVHKNYHDDDEDNSMESPLPTSTSNNKSNGGSSNSSWVSATATIKAASTFKPKEITNKSSRDTTYDDDEEEEDDIKVINTRNRSNTNSSTSNTSNVKKSIDIKAENNNAVNTPINNKSHTNTTTTTTSANKSMNNKLFQEEDEVMSFEMEEEDISEEEYYAREQLRRKQAQAMLNKDSPVSGPSVNSTLNRTVSDRSNISARSTDQQDTVLSVPKTNTTTTSNSTNVSPRIASSLIKGSSINNNAINVIDTPEYKELVTEKESLQSQVKQLQENVTSLETQLHTIQQKQNDIINTIKVTHSNEVDKLKAYTTQLESSINDEKEKRRVIEATHHSLQSDQELVIRKMKREHDDVLRDQEVTIKAEYDTKYKKLLLEKDDTYHSEIESLKLDVLAVQSKYTNVQSEYTLLQERLKNNTQEEKNYHILLEEVTEMKKKLSAENEEVKKVSQGVIEKYEKDIHDLKEKLNTVTFQKHKISAEYDMLVTKYETVNTEKDVLQISVIQSTQQLQTAEMEISRIKAEINIYKKENESLNEELKKLKVLKLSVDEDTSATESTLRRSKSLAESEVNSLQSRLHELEYLNKALQQDLDSSQQKENQAVREVQKMLDTSEFENKRLGQQMKEYQSTIEGYSTRIKTYEAEIHEMQDKSFEKDKSIYEYKYKVESLQNDKIRLEEQKMLGNTDYQELKTQYMELSDKYSQLTTKYTADINEWKQKYEVEKDKKTSNAHISNDSYLGYSQGNTSNSSIQQNNINDLMMFKLQYEIETKLKNEMTQYVKSHSQEVDELKRDHQYIVKQHMEKEDEYKTKIKDLSTEANTYKKVVEDMEKRMKTLENEILSIQPPVMHSALMGEDMYNMTPVRDSTLYPPPPPDTNNMSYYTSTGNEGLGGNNSTLQLQRSSDINTDKSMLLLQNHLLSLRDHLAQTLNHTPARPTTTSTYGPAVYYTNSYGVPSSYIGTPLVPTTTMNNTLNRSAVMMTPMGMYSTPYPTAYPPRRDMSILGNDANVKQLQQKVEFQEQRLRQQMDVFNQFLLTQPANIQENFSQVHVHSPTHITSTSASTSSTGMNEHNDLDNNDNNIHVHHESNDSHPADIHVHTASDDITVPTTAFTTSSSTSTPTSTPAIFMTDIGIQSHVKDAFNDEYYYNDNHGNQYIEQYMENNSRNTRRLTSSNMIQPEAITTSQIQRQDYTTTSNSNSSNNRRGASSSNNTYTIHVYDDVDDDDHMKATIVEEKNDTKMRVKIIDMDNQFNNNTANISQYKNNTVVKSTRSDLQYNKRSNSTSNHGNNKNNNNISFNSQFTTPIRGIISTPYQSTSIYTRPSTSSTSSLLFAYKNMDGYNRSKTTSTTLKVIPSSLASVTVGTRASGDSMLYSSDFSAIYDGGFHPDYWRTKYLQK